MPLTNTQTNAFLEYADNMNIPHNALVKLQKEGANNEGYLEITDKNFLEHWTDHLKRPGGQVNVGGAMVAVPDFKFGGKLQMRLESALNIVRLYKTVGIYITNSIIKWDPIIKDFKQEWGVLFKR